MSAWRKAVEAGLSMELAVALGDRRMLELYVNYAQLGPRIYGSVRPAGTTSTPRRPR
jgi:monofunctional biosynthetic peptidoglycan transglycosylase